MRLNIEDAAFFSEIDIVDVMFVNVLNFSTKLSVLSMFNDEWVNSFNFWILEEFESNCIENLLEDIDLIDEVKKFDENDEENCWNKKSNDKIENERNEFVNEVCCCFLNDVVN